MRRFVALLILGTIPLFAYAQIEAPRFSYPSPPPSKSFSPFPLYSLAPYKLSYDIDMSPYAGAEDLLFAHRTLERLEICFLKRNPNLAYSKMMFARFSRLTALTTIWLPLNYLAMVVQHEVFGHGYRIRSLSSKRAHVVGYSIFAPPPYGDGGGATSYNIGENLTTTQESAIAIAGVEATAILAQTTKLKWLMAKRIDPRQSVLYLLSQHDLNLYISSLKDNDQDLSGHDINAYIQTLNYTYPDNILSKGRLRSLSWINLADPFTFYAIYSWFHYLSSGKETKIPMIGSLYLPGLRLGLTPFGPEVFFENYLLYREFPLYFYFKGGEHAKNGYYGLGLYAPYLFSLGPFVFGCRVDLWRQPKLLLQPGTTSILDIDFNTPPDPNDPLYPYSERHKKRLGGSGSLIFWLRATKKIGVEAELGYKAQGFLPGYSLKAFPTVRVAFTLMY